MNKGNYITFRKGYVRWYSFYSLSPGWMDGGMDGSTMAYFKNCETSFPLFEI